MYDFGPLAAQDDTQLMNYFHITSQLSDLMDEKQPSPNCIFVARPGGGKTALVQWLESQSKLKSFKRPVIFIRPAHTQLVATDDDFNLEDNRILIQFELYTGLIDELLKRNVLNSELKKICASYFKSELGNSIKSFFKEKFEGISILGCGFTLQPSDRRTYLGVIKRNKGLDEVSSIVRKIATAVSPMVVSDDPEAMVTKGLQYASPDNAMRIGAYLSVMTHLHGLGCQVMLFLKEHVLQCVVENYPDSSHFEDRLEGLQWTDSDLLGLLELRLHTRIGKDWSKVFNFGQESMKKNVFPFLINGPRDLLFTCNTVGRSGHQITQGAIKQIIGTLRNNKWNEIRKHFGIQWPLIADFAQAVIIAMRKVGNPDRITRDDFKRIVEGAFEEANSPLHNLRSKKQWINTCIWGSPTVDERLFFIGCLGYTAENKKIYPWGGRSLEGFRTSSTLFVSPLFLS